jgi:DNA-binding NarL/FixJ family response regulator
MATPTSKNPEQPNPAPRRVRVLVVDDSEMMRKTICQYLAGQPSIELVGTAADGIEAIQQAETLRPDVVLIDIEMPRMNGLKATRILRRKFESIRVFVMSLHDGDQVRAACKRHGAHGFISKINLAEELERWRA